MYAVTSLLTSPQGSFFFHLSATVLVFSALIVTFGRQDRDSDFPTGRIILGLSVLLILRLANSLSAAALEAAGQPVSMLLAIERGLTTASWAILVWLWAYPAPSRAGDTASWILTALITTLTLISLGLVERGANVPAWGPRWLLTLWQAIALLVLSAGIALLFMRRPYLWGYGGSMLAVLATGEILQILYNAQAASEAPVLIRLAQIAAFPLLLTLPQRILPVPRPVALPSSGHTISPERKRVNLPPGVLASFLHLGTEVELAQLAGRITEAVSYALVADICLLVSRPTENGEIIVFRGYDQVLEQSIQGAQIASRHLPMLSSAIQKNTPLRLPASSASSDLIYLSKALGLPKSGHLLVAPIAAARSGEIGALVLLTPYSSRTWSRDDQSYLALAAASAGELIDHVAGAGDTAMNSDSLRRQLDEARDKVQKAETEARLLKQQLSSRGEQAGRKPDAELIAALEAASRNQKSLKAKIEALEEKIHTLEQEAAEKRWEETIQHLQAENIQLQLTVHELETERDALSERNRGLEQTNKESMALLERLQEENDRLHSEFEAAGLTGVSSSSNGKAHSPAETRAQAELEKAFEEIKKLKNLAGDTEIRMLELENLAAAGKDVSEQWKAIITMAEELRQPMSSILGYSDFLLTESVGLLGSMQRKFLERVKTSTDRMSGMVEDLIHVTTAESGRLRLSIGQVNLTDVVDAAVLAASGQIRAKEITLLVNIPDDLPTIEGDQDAIRLSLLHLLRNAVSASPSGGEISIDFRLDVEETGKTIRISVQDSGGGIGPDDIPRVFDRRLHSKDPRIPGVGATNAGLSISKTLIEAHGGRIWVENREGEGATWTFLLPRSQSIPRSVRGKREA